MKNRVLILILAATMLCTMLFACRKQPAVLHTTPSAIPNWSEVPKNEYDAALFRTEENGFIRYGEGSLVGVDVSAHQKEIDWEKVRQAGVDFAVLRAAYRGYTGGGLNMDPYFQKNFKAAKAAGLQVGVYLFSQAISVEEAVEEAEFLLEILDGEMLSLPVYFDWEYVEAESRTQNMGSSEVTAFAQAFCSKIEEAGYEAGVYFNQSLGYLVLNLSRLTDYAFWLAEYQSVPNFNFDFGLWQYTSSGTVPGIEGDVDLNVLFPK